MRAEPNWRRYYDSTAALTQFRPEFDPLEAHRCRLAMELMPRSPIRSILDVGCGDGYLCECLAKRLPETRVAGVDLSERRIARAADRSPALSLAVSSAEALPYASRSFDLVTCVEVLEHLEDPLPALQELGRVSSCHVVITVPYDEIGAEVVCPHCLRHFRMHGHVSRFTPESLSDIASKAGLSVTRTETYLVPVGASVGLPRGVAALGNWLRRVSGTKPDFLGALLRRS
jgi:SAM-dependent methyltransferase